MTATSKYPTNKEEKEIHELIIEVTKPVQDNRLCFECGRLIPLAKFKDHKCGDKDAPSS